MAGHLMAASDQRTPGQHRVSVVTGQGNSADFQQTFVPGRMLFEPEQVGDRGRDIGQAGRLKLLQAQPATAALS